MTSAHDPSSSNGKAERLLGALTGVVSAHIVREPDGQIVEIHVLATPDLHPKQVVRNVESAMSAGLGIAIDRRIVSVAQVRTAPKAPNGQRSEGDSAAAPGPMADADATSDAPADPPEKPAGRPRRRRRAKRREMTSRLEYVRFSSRRDAENCVCEVVLRDSDGEYTGTGGGPDTASGRAESAARAVLDAITEARPDLRLELDGAILSASRGRGFVIISAHAILQRVSVPLAGAATLNRSPEEAAILAALQATNRWSA